MKTSTKVCIIINIISLIGAGLLFSSIMAVISFDGGFGFNFSREAIVGLLFFLIWAVTGFILFIRFLRKLSFPRKLFFVTLSSTAVYALFIFVLYNINSINYAPVASFRQVSGFGANLTVVYVFIGVLTLLYLLFLAVTFRTMSKPIKKINGIVTEIGEGKKKVKFKVGGGKEFEKIASGLQQIDKRLSEKDKLIKVASEEYEKVVPKQFLKFLGKKNSFELDLGNSITKEVTTMFCDIRNSTKTSDTLSLADNFKFINDYLATITPIVRKHYGFIDKYLGDGILAVFYDANKALSCAKEIVRMVNVKNSLEKKPYSLKVGIGIHTGEVVFGVVGDRDRKSPTIISDSVNYTSKMQEVNKLYGTTIIVSKRTLNALSSIESSNFRYIGHLNFDGENTRFSIFEYLGILRGDKASLIIEEKQLFEEGVRFFDDKKFDSAKDIFEKILSRIEDAPSRFYLDRVNSELYNNKKKK